MDKDQNQNPDEKKEGENTGNTPDAPTEGTN